VNSHVPESPRGADLATSLTQDEYLVLQHLLSGKSTEEIAAALDWPLQAVRNCTRTLITLVLDKLEASTALPAPPGSTGASPSNRT
jgi:DNA-binding NarL/FixJ family response regulator